MDVSFWIENFGLAGLFMAGFGLGWTSCVKILVTPERERLGRAETDLNRMREKIETEFWSKK
jgi:hypothetical protein